MPDLGSSLVWAGDPDAARAVLDEAVERAAAVGDERSRMHALVLRRLLLEEGDATEARREAERALAVFEAAGDERGLSRAWRLVSELGREDMLVDEEALERALVHARNAEDVGEQIGIYWQVGFNIARGPTPVEEGIRRCQDILVETEGNRTLSAEMFHALGHLMARRGAFDEALQFRFPMSRHQPGERRHVGVLGAR